MVQLSDELLDLVDAEAGRRGVSRSALVREAVSTYLAGTREASIAREIVQGYTRIPSGTPDAWGDLETAGDVSALELTQRLEADERAAGHRPW